MIKPSIGSTEELQVHIRKLEAELAILKDAQNEFLDKTLIIKAIIENSKDWIWEIDTSGNHTYSNNAIVDILGYSIKEIVNQASATTQCNYRIFRPYK